MIRSIQTTVKNAYTVGRRTEAHVHGREIGQTTVESVEFRSATHKDYTSGKLVGAQPGIFDLLVDVGHNFPGTGGDIVVYLSEINTGHIVRNIG